MVSADGSVALNVIVDYKKTADELIESECVQLTGTAKSIVTATIDRYYGARTKFLSTNATRMTPLRIADKLSALGISDAILVEYSKNFCDYRILGMLLATVDMQHLLPPRQSNVLSAYHLVANNLLKGFKNLGLEAIFPLACPQSRLPKFHHEADQDAFKLRELCMRVYNKTLKIGKSYRHSCLYISY